MYPSKLACQQRGTPNPENERHRQRSPTETRGSGSRDGQGGLISCNQGPPWGTLVTGEAVYAGLWADGNSLYLLKYALSLNLHQKKSMQAPGWLSWLKAYLQLKS